MSGTTELRRGWHLSPQWVPTSKYLFYRRNRVAWSQVWTRICGAIELEWLNVTDMKKRNYLQRTSMFTPSHSLSISMALEMFSHGNELFPLKGKDAGECIKLLWVLSAGLQWWIIARYYWAAHMWCSRMVSLGSFLSSSETHQEM